MTRDETKWRSKNVMLMFQFSYWNGFILMWVSIITHRHTHSRFSLSTNIVSLKPAVTVLWPHDFETTGNVCDKSQAFKATGHSGLVYINYNTSCSCLEVTKWVCEDITVIVLRQQKC